MLEHPIGLGVRQHARAWASICAGVESSPLSAAPRRASSGILCQKRYERREAISCAVGAATVPAGAALNSNR
jgi:hypothetical protein